MSVTIARKKINSESGCSPRRLVFPFLATRTGYRIVWIALLALACFSFPRADENVSRGAKTISRLASVPLSWKLPVEGKDYDIRRLPSGLTFYLKSDTTIPLIHLQCYVRAGSFYEQGGQPQVARVVARMLRECGSGAMTAEKMDSMLDYYAGDLRVECGPDLLLVDGMIPSKHTQTLVQMVAGMLSQPAFNKEKLDYVLRRIQLEESAEAEDPFYLCGRMFNQLVYAEHPYGYLQSADGVERVTLDAVTKFFQEYYFPANVFVVVTGDFKEKSLLAWWEEEYKPSSPNRELKLPPPAEPRPRPGVFLLQKPINQSSIYFGLQAAPAGTPDVYLIQLLNHMVGGSSFASRFTQQVRDREGLAYRVDSLFETDVLGPATFIARCRTKTESTVRALDAMLWILGMFRDGQIPDSEFQAGRAGLKNGFVKRFTTLEDVLYNFLMLEILGRPRAYLETYQDKVQSITADQLRQAAVKYFDPARMTFVIVGDTRSAEQEYKKFGQIFHLNEPAPSTAVEKKPGGALELVDPQVRQAVADAFDGEPEALPLTADLVVYWYWGGKSKETGSSWYSARQFASAEEARRLLALPEGNTAENVTRFKIPAGVTVLRGKCASRKGNPGFGDYAEGGGEQIYVPDPAVVVADKGVH